MIIWITSWNRREFLKQTIDSLIAQADIPVEIYVVDNGSEFETTEYIKSETRIKRYWLLDKNKGINWPIENLLPTIIDNQQYVMICDQDIYFNKPLSNYIVFLENHADFGAVVGIDAPEHNEIDSFEFNKEQWLVKNTSRGGGLVLTIDVLQRMFPLPNIFHFDSYCMTRLQEFNLKIGILVKGSVHLGWKKGDSCWQLIDIPERYILYNGKVIEQRKFFDANYYESNKQKGLDFLAYGDWQKIYGKWIVESLELKAKNILDVGCSCGANAAGMAMAGAYVSGIDLSQHMINLGRQKWENFPLYVCDAANIHLWYDNTFDLVHSLQVWEYFRPDQIPIILKELYRVGRKYLFSVLDTKDLYKRHNRTNFDNLNLQTLDWWKEQVVDAGWQLVGSTILEQHQLGYFKKYNWDYILAIKND